MSNKPKRKSRFLLGALVGAALGILFAPAKGSETRRLFRKKMDELMEHLKKVDLGEIKDSFSEKIEGIQEDLETLDKEKIAKIARKKAQDLKVKAEELFELAKEKGTPILQDAAKEVLEKVVEASQEIIKKLETKK